MNPGDANWLLSQEQARLNNLLAHYFGYYLVILSAGDTPQLSCPISNHIVVNRHCHNAAQETLVAAWEELPFAADSIDAVILSHGMDYYIDPQPLLKELALILRHDGRLVITGWNPARLKARKLAKLYHVQAVKLHLCSSIMAELKTAGFSISEVHYFGFFAVKNKCIAGFLNRLLTAIWPSIGCGYVIVAQKNTLGIIPAKPNWDTPLLNAEKTAVPSCRVK